MDMTYGKGLDATDSAKKPSEYAAMKGLFTKSCLQKVVADYVMMGQCSFQVVYSQDHNMIVEVQHIPVETLEPQGATKMARLRLTTTQRIGRT
jgi:hypothetical protein